MFVNTKNPYMFRSFSFDNPQRAICRALRRYYNVFRWFAFVEYLLGMWLYVYIIYLCVCVLGAVVFVKDLFVKWKIDLCVCLVLLCLWVICLWSERSICVCAWCYCQWTICFWEFTNTTAPITHTNRSFTSQTDLSQTQQHQAHTQIDLSLHKQIFHKHKSTKHTHK
jgi:hypothetical protein